MPEQQERKHINVPFEDLDLFNRVTAAADEHESGKGPLLRLVVKRVEAFGDGDLLTGLARLQMAQSDGMSFDDTHKEE